MLDFQSPAANAQSNLRDDAAPVLPCEIGQDRRRPASEVDVDLVQRSACCFSPDAPSQ
jgi:hypothetical protein